MTVGQVNAARWRPYQDAPLLTAPMTLGPGNADPDDEQALCDYLGALVAQRSAPVHVAVAFNAAFFGYDLTDRAYVGGPLELDDFPHVTFGEVTAALPVGAMVTVTAGTSPLYAEVVYKEGAHPALDAGGDTPGWLSGAPANAIGPGQLDLTVTDPVLLERLVCDFDAFGQDFAVTRGRLDAWQARGKHVDTAGHLLLRSRYASVDAAQHDDDAFFADYLLGPARERLLSFAAPQPLLSMLTDDAGPEQVRAALLGLLRTVQHALTTAPGVRMWGAYAFTTDSFTGRLAHNGPLGGNDLRSVARSLGRAPDARRSRFATTTKQVSYLALRPRLRQVDDATGPLSGTRYPLTVCHANTVISDYVTEHASGGLLDTGTRVTLDDRWQDGGIWRTEHPAASDADLDPLCPAGLGWVSSLPTPAPEPEPELELELEGEPDDEPDVTIGDSQLSWVTPVRMAHLVDGRSPLPAPAFALLSSPPAEDSRALRLSLRHDGEAIAPDEATQDEARPQPARGRQREQLTPVLWPLMLLPAVKVTFVLPTAQNGTVAGAVLSAFTTRLPAPVIVDGVTYDHEFDPAILTRESAPGQPRRDGTVRVLNLPLQILRAVRRYGWLEEDGTAVLPTADLEHVVNGEAAEPVDNDAVYKALFNLVAGGDLRLRRYVLDAHGQPVAPIDSQVGTLEVVCWSPLPAQRPASGVAPAPEPPALRGYVSTQDVRWFLRRIQGTPGDEARWAWAEQLRRTGRPSRPLPAGYTFVREHLRVRRW